MYPIAENYELDGSCFWDTPSTLDSKPELEYSHDISENGREFSTFFDTDYNSDADPTGTCYQLPPDYLRLR